MIFHLATLAFIVLKLMHVIDWSWWLVFAPTIGFLVIAVLFPLLCVGVFAYKMIRG